MKFILSIPPMRGYYSLVNLLILAVVLMGCNSNGTPGLQMDPYLELQKEIKTQIKSLGAAEEKRIDSNKVLSYSILDTFYRGRDFKPAWILKDSAAIWTDTMIQLIRNARSYGLLPSAYHVQSLIRAQEAIRLDSTQSGIRKDPAALAKMELALTDAFLSMARHLHRGHLSLDSLEKESAFRADTYSKALEKAVSTQNLRAVLEEFEPDALGYREIKNVLPDFLRTANFSKQYTRLDYPYKDSLAFIRSLITRFKEDKYIGDSIQRLDSVALSKIIKKVQTERRLTIDGKYGRQLVNSLNNTDVEKFLTVAINLDRYRMKPDTLAKRYLLVNLPSFELRVINQEKTVLTSRVIIGKPQTPTPLISSRMDQIIVFPTWTIPAGIIANEILPALKRNPGYLARKGYGLYDYSNNEVDPYSVDWSKYNKSIPYKVVQGEGIGNALGVMKFNFPNKHYVYLHDTNQRGLFQNDYRSLSHGCVRVQDWVGLYKYVLEQDSIKSVEKNESFTSTDSVAVWLQEEKRRVITVKDQLAVYFRYYTAAGKDGKLETYQDIYGFDGPIRAMVLAEQ